MTFMDDIRSGRCAIYGQFSSFLSVVFLILFGFFNLVSTLIIFCILGWVFAGFIILVEVPFLCACCVNDSLKRVAAFFSDNRFKALLYLVLATIMWCSTNVAATSLIVSALFLTFTCAFYGIASFRNEEPAKSSMVGGAQTASAVYGGRV